MSRTLSAWHAQRPSTRATSWESARSQNQVTQKDRPNLGSQSNIKTAFRYFHEISFQFDDQRHTAVHVTTATLLVTLSQAFIVPFRPSTLHSFTSTRGDGSSVVMQGLKQTNRPQSTDLALWWKETPSGYKYIDDTIGAGIVPAPSKVVQLHYTVTLLSSGTTLGTSRDGQPLTLAVGKHNVPIWDGDIFPAILMSHSPTPLLYPISPLRTHATSPLCLLTSFIRPHRGPDRHADRWQAALARAALCTARLPGRIRARRKSHSPI